MISADLRIAVMHYSVSVRRRYRYRQYLLNGGMDLAVLGLPADSVSHIPTSLLIDAVRNLHAVS